MSLRWLPEQGRRGIPDLGPVDNCHLAPDSNIDTEVKLLIFRPNKYARGPKDLHWAIEWKVSNGGSRLIHLSVFHHRYEPTVWRYVYWGGETRTVGPTAKEARSVSLGTMSLEKRQGIEDVALHTAVAQPNGKWNSQNWTADLLCGICNAKIMDQTTWSNAVAFAAHAWDDHFPTQ